MPGLLSGSTLRRGGSGKFIDLKGAQPQFPPDADQTTGYTISTDNFSITTTTNSLGNLVHYKGQIYSNIPNGNIIFTGTGTGTVIVSQPTISTSTITGALVVNGGIGVGGNMVIAQDIIVNGITVGQGFQGYNNIVLSGPVALTPPNNFNNGQESISIGWGSLQGIASTNRSIAIGTNALSSGTNFSSNIGIGDNALTKLGTIPSALLLSITSATNSNPLILTVPGNTYTTGTEVFINNCVGMTELNAGIYYVTPTGTNQLIIFSDDILSSPVDSTSYGSYINNGVINKTINTDNNIGIGTNAGISLYDGRKNFFLGDNIAKNLTTGSYNLFIGNDVANNLTKGSGIVSIMGDNLVDGQDNQINIGGIFYYDGLGSLRLNSSIFAGTGVNTTSSSTGAMIINGGLAIQQDAWVNGRLTVINGIVGAITTATNLSGGSTGSLPYQLSTGTTTQLPIGNYGEILYSDGVRPVWTALSAIASSTSSNALSVYVNETIENFTYYIALDQLYDDFSPLYNTSTFTYNTQGGVLNSPQMVISSSTTATSTITGALQVVGGVGVQGSIYSVDGNPKLNNLLYTPQSTISVGVPPSNPRLGDFWIDPSLGATFQYVLDGVNSIWLQFTGL